jgi:hypothetical protein
VLKLLFIVYPTSRCTCLTVQIIYINLILTQFVGVSRVLSIPWNKPIIQLSKLLNLIQKHKTCFCLINYEHNFVLLDRKKQQTKRISLFFVSPKLAADVMYLSPVVKRTASVNVLVPRWFPALITHSYIDPSFKPVIRRLVAFVSFLIAVREPTCLQKTLQRSYLTLDSFMFGSSYYNTFQMCSSSTDNIHQCMSEVSASVSSQRLCYSGMWCYISGILAFQGNVVASYSTVKVPKFLLGYLKPTLPWNTGIQFLIMQCLIPQNRIHNNQLS